MGEGLAVSGGGVCGVVEGWGGEEQETEGLAVSGAWVWGVCTCVGCLGGGGGGILRGGWSLEGGKVSASGERCREQYMFLQ